MALTATHFSDFPANQYTVRSSTVFNSFSMFFLFISNIWIESLINNMSSGTKRKKTHIPSDFKRRKAKVGKRALVPANNTDTSFKAATVQIRDQSISTASSKKGEILLSARGRSLQELSYQLHHPAGVVRLSAVRGLYSIIEETPNHALVTHLSSLLPIISKCACLDEEDNVRNMGLNALQLLVRRTIDDPNDDDVIATQNRKKLWKSFIPLIAAYITSALHSLDRSIRLDGSRAVDILSRFLPIDKGTVANMLPAYITLLQDYCQYQNSTASQRNVQNKKSNKRALILHALVSLFQSMKQEDVERALALDPDLIVDESLSTSTGHGIILLEPKQERSAPILPAPTAATMEDYFKILFERDLTVHNDGQTLSESNLTNLLSKLRDIFVEIWERGGMQLKNNDLEELSLLIQSIHLLWKNFLQPSSMNASTSTMLKKMWSMMRDSIPVSANSNQDENVMTTNGLLCLAVIEIGSALNTDQQWAAPVLEYLLPTLDAKDFHAASTTMNVITGLLLNNTTLPAKDILDSTLQEMVKVYFSSLNMDFNILRSAGARKAVHIATHILQEQYGVWRHEEKYIPDMIRHLLDYLVSYRNDFLSDSVRIVETLLHCVNRILLPNLDKNDEAILNVQTTLRLGLVPLFKFKSKRERCIFQLYPASLQHKTICLIVALQSPPDPLVQSLGKLSKNNEIPKSISKFIVEAMHLTRKTMPMQRYLGFVMTSIGVPNKVSSENLILTNLDFDARKASRVLRRCGSSKVLPMVQGVLSSWLNSIVKSPCDDNENDNYRLIRFRAALLIVAVLSHDLEGKFLHDLVPELCHTLIKCCIAFFSYCSWDISSNNGDSSELFSQFQRPMIVSF